MPQRCVGDGPRTRRASGRPFRRASCGLHSALHGAPGIESAAAAIRLGRDFWDQHTFPSGRRNISACVAGLGNPSRPRPAPWRGGSWRSALSQLAPSGRTLVEGTQQGHSCKGSQQRARPISWFPRTLTSDALTNVVVLWYYFTKYANKNESLRDNAGCVSGLIVRVLVADACCLFGVQPDTEGMCQLRLAIVFLRYRNIPARK